MEKSKIWVLVALMLALFFFVKINADASAWESYPNYANGDITGVITMPDYNNNYKFFIGADSISIDNNNVYISYASGTARFDMDIITYQGYHDFVPQYGLYDMYQFFGQNWVDVTFTYTDNGFDTFLYYIDKKPYVILDGEKYYLSNQAASHFVIEPIVFATNIIMGVEIECTVSYDATNVSSDVLRTFFGSANINVFANGSYNISGMRYISTGESAIVDSINNHGNSIFTAIQSFASNISSQLTSWKNDLAAQMSSWQTALDNKLDEVIETLTKSFDTSSAESSNSELSGSLDSWEAAEGTTMSSAKVEVSNYDTSSAFNFAPALVSSLSLVTAFSTGFLNASGDFTTAIAVMFSLVFVSVLVGLVRFVRR